MDQYPDLYDFISIAISNPKKWLLTYRIGMKIDGVNIDACFTDNMNTKDVNTYSLFFNTHVAHGLVGAVDWKEHHSEVEFWIDKMMQLHNLTPADWSVFNDLANEKLWPNEYLSKIARSIDFDEDMYSFSLIPFKHLQKINGMTSKNCSFSVKAYSVK